MAAREFRLQGKNLFLTWPQNATPKETVLQNIREEFGENLEFAVVAAEAHADGNPHLHAVVSLRRRVRKRGAACLNHLAGDQQGNYQAARSLIKTVQYVAKAGDFTAHGVDVGNYLEAAKKKRSTKAGIVATALMSGTTLKELSEMDPGFVLMHLQKLKAFQNQLACWKEVRQTTPWVPLTMATDTPLALEMIAGWLNTNMPEDAERTLRQPQLIVSSPGGLGKTWMVDVKLAAHRRLYKHPGGKWFDGFDDNFHELIIFDEFNNNIPTTVMNKIADGSSVMVEIKGGVVSKNKNLPVIVLTNLAQHQVYPNQHDAIRQAFFSRFLWVELEPGEELWKLWRPEEGEETEEVDDDDSEETAGAVDLFSLINFET